MCGLSMIHLGLDSPPSSIQFSGPKTRFASSIILLYFLFSSGWFIGFCFLVEFTYCINVSSISNTTNNGVLCVFSVWLLDLLALLDFFTDALTCLGLLTSVLVLTCLGLLTLVLVLNCLGLLTLVLVLTCLGLLMRASAALALFF